MKQFVHGKPNLIGLKTSVRCSICIVYNFEIYQGTSTGINSEHKYLGLDGSVVMLLYKNIPQGYGYNVYFDNFFSSLPLV